MTAALISIFGWHLRPFTSHYPSANELDRQAQVWAIQHGFVTTIVESGLLRLSRGNRTLEVTSMLLNTSPECIHYIKTCFDRAENDQVQANS